MNQVIRSVPRTLFALVVLSIPALASGPPSQSVTIPPGATGFTIEVRDSDVFSDDILDTSSGQIPPGTQPGTPLHINYDNIKCVNGTVHGPKGSSGERCAEIFAIVTFTFPSGSTVTVETKVQEYCCPAVAFELPPGFYAGPKY